MTPAGITRLVAMQALAADRAGDGGPILELFTSGLQVLSGLRTELRMLDALSVPLRRRYTLVGLPRGASVRIFHCGGAPTGRYGLPLITIKNVRERMLSYRLADDAARVLMERVSMRQDAAVRVAFGIERARKQLLAMAEERSRWL